jgi:hypothetical protein
MKAWHILVGATGLILAGQLAAADVTKLTALERSQGWRFLFDGVSLSDWRGYRQNKLPANWQVVEGSLTCGGGTALATTEDFKDFEIAFDWKVGAGGSAAVYYRVDEDIAEVGDSGPVMQLAGGEMGGNGGLNKPWREITLQPEVWYRARIMVFGNQVEHLINGERILTYVIDSPDWQVAVAGSRYKALRDYGRLDTGRIVLSGHGASFRNIKLRAL